MSLRGVAVPLKSMIRPWLRFLLLNNPESREISADLVQQRKNAIIPEINEKTIRDGLRNALTEKIKENNKQIHFFVYP